MASLFDQYEQSSSSSAFVGKPKHSTFQPPTNTGFINATIEDDVPIFNKQRISFNPPDHITHLCVCNNFLVMAMTTNTLLRIDLEHPDNPDEVEIPKSVDDIIHKVFMDHSGRHLIISMASGDNYYLSRNSKKPRALNKFKGHQINAIGWNHYNSNENSTGEFLIGTSRGVIYETEITSVDENKFFQGSLEQYAKQVFTLSKDRASPVTGLSFEHIPSRSDSERRIVVVATLSSRLYQFVGTVPNNAEVPIFSHVFSPYENTPDRFLELPGNLGYSDLCLFYSKFRTFPKSFAWMTGPGVFYGGLDSSLAAEAGKESITSNTKLIPYQCEIGEKPSDPLAIVLTEFHVLVLFQDRLKAICTLNEQLIYDDVISERFGKLVNMCRDPMKGTIWCFTSQAVFKFKVTRESRDVWQMYLDRGEYDLSKDFCRDSPSNMNRVLTKQADDLFKNNQFEKSAQIYAQTQNSFEEIVLKFINNDHREALKAFLLNKMNLLRPQDKTQMTMLVTWLTELFLNQLGSLKEDGRDMSETYETLQEEFRKFLAFSKVKDCVNNNRATIYELIASHGDVEDMIFFAVLMQDYEKVIAHHIQQNNYKSALEFLTKQSDVSLFYKFSPVLMQNIPKETVSAWISKEHQLDPKSLIPALVQYDAQKFSTQGNEAIRYLEYCVQSLHVDDRAIHNYLLSLYCKLQPVNLIRYLNMQGQDADQVCYDLKYGLRLCSEHSHHLACVHIYSTMGLYEEAVELALKVDVDLAKQNADKPIGDEELKKKLWLRIARHVVEEEKDIKRAMEFLQECELLKIEDILPFFPDFVTIDHFKDAITASLQEYNQHIESLKSEMEEATQNADEIRAEIHSIRNKFAKVNCQDPCTCCGFPLMTRSFYVFPCMHKFHMDCLIAELIPHLSSKSRSRVEEIQRKLAAQEGTPPTSTKQRQTTTTTPDKKLTLKESLDEIIGAECVYCGEIMISCIDKPFIDPDEYESVIKSWL